MLMSCGGRDGTREFVTRIDRSGRGERRGVEIEVSSRLIRASLPPSLCVELLLISRATVKVAVTPIVRYAVPLPPSVFVRLSVSVWAPCISHE